MQRANCLCTGTKIVFIEPRVDQIGGGGGGGGERKEMWRWRRRRGIKLWFRRRENKILEEEIEAMTRKLG